MNFNVNDPVRRQLTSDNGSFQPKKRGVNLSIVRGVGNDKYQVLSCYGEENLGQILVCIHSLHRVTPVYLVITWPQ